MGPGIRQDDAVWYASGHFAKLTPVPTPLPDAEQLLLALIQKMQPDVGPDAGLIGIHTGGVWLAERLHDGLHVATPLGSLDVSFYRDDYDQIGLHRDVKRSNIPFEVEGRHLVLVDDVLYTGRTIRAAMNELFDYGRPASIRLAALIDRGDRELPIAAQWAAQTVEVPHGMGIELKRDEGGRLSLAWYEKSAPDVA
jgi:pyrimidine operon attenuation protein/uracil phosphoribosyltransferase